MAYTPTTRPTDVAATEDMLLTIATALATGRGPLTAKQCDEIVKSAVSLHEAVKRFDPFGDEQEGE